MNKPHYLAVVCALTAWQLSAQKVLYVTPKGAGDGSSWDQSSDLKSALLKAKSGDRVWVAAGIYPTSSEGNRESSFILPSGVQMLAGFRGSETDASTRDPARLRTVLSGEIGGPEPDDNAYSILKVVDAEPSTLVDGFIFENAYANGAGPVGDHRRAGGAAWISISGPGQSNEVIFINCSFENNYARDGGAVYVDGAAGKARPGFVSCQFKNNKADLDGGAVYNDGRRRGIASPSFTDCRFDANEANYGGAIFNHATKGESHPRLSNCSFRENRAYIRGTSLYNIAHQGESRPQLIGCHFADEQDPENSNSGLVRQ